MSKSRYSVRIRAGQHEAPTRPFADREALDCTPTRQLRWYHIAAAAGALAVAATIVVRLV